MVIPGLLCPVQRFAELAESVSGRDSPGGRIARLFGLSELRSLVGLALEYSKPITEKIILSSDYH